MASGPYFDQRRGTFRVQWFDGKAWRRPVVYRIQPWKPGSPPPKKVPMEVHAALAAYGEREKAARKDRPTDPERTIVEFLAEYRTAYDREQAAASLLQLQQVHRRFLDWCETEKITRLRDLGPLPCQRFLDARAGVTSRKTGKPISPKRLNVERGLLMGAWTRAIKLGAVRENPWTATQAPGWDRQRRKRQRRPSWSPEEFDRLYEAARPWLRDLLTLGTQTGLRIAALIGLEWRDIEWAREGPGFGLIRVRPEADKVGRGYSVPISRKCHDMLIRRQAAKDAHERYVLTAARGGKIRVAVADRSIRAAARRAGLGDITSPAHMLRRSFGRWAVLGHLTGNPVPLYVVSRWLGHSDVQTSMIYLDITEGESQNWMAEQEPRQNQSP